MKNYNTNPQRFITLNGEYWALERVLRWSNRKCLGHSMSFRSEELQALTNLTRTFEALLKDWHEERIQEIRAKLGPYVLYQ